MRNLFLSFVIALMLMCGFAALVEAQSPLRLHGATKPVISQQEFMQDLDIYVGASLATMSARKSTSGKPYRVVMDDDMVLALTYELIDLYMRKGVRLQQ